MEQISNINNISPYISIDEIETILYNNLNDISLLSSILVNLFKNKDKYTDLDKINDILKGNYTPKFEINEEEKINKARFKKFINHYFNIDDLLNKTINIIDYYLVYSLNSIIYTFLNKRRLSYIRFISRLPLNSELIESVKHHYQNNKNKYYKNPEFFQLKIQEYLCANKCQKSKKNKKVIEFLTKIEVEKNIFKYIFNELTIADWLNLFLYNKDIYDYSLFNILEDEKIEKINNNIFKFEYVLLEKSYNNNFLLSSLLLMFNLQRYYLIGKKPNKKERKKPSLISNYIKLSK